MLKHHVTELKKLITKHVNAQVELSWAGSQPPQEIPAIEAKAKRAKQNLDKHIRWLNSEYRDVL
jgi:hypothetical protein